MWKAVILQKLSKDKWKDVSQDDLASIRELTIEGQLRWKGVDDSGLSLLSNLEELTFKS